MTISSSDTLNSILASLDRIVHVRASEIPEIDLYMDQVTTFMEQHMRQTTRNPGEDKILTKTMINNYTKNELLPPPNKKKYTKEHVIMLIYIYYLKGFLSINDIATLLCPIKEEFFGKKVGDIDMEEIYERVFSMESEKISSLKNDVKQMYEASTKQFTDASDKDRDNLQMFDFICRLSYDVYVKKLLIEKLIDEMEPSDIARKKEKKEKEKNRKDQ